MGIYKEFVDFVIKNGKFVGFQPGLTSPKPVYRISRYTVMLDPSARTEDALVISVIKNGEPVYVSRLAVKGQRLLGEDVFPEELSDWTILEELLEELKKFKSEEGDSTEKLVFEVGGKKVELSLEEVKEIVTTKLSNNPFWMNNGMLTKEEVRAFFDRSADLDLVKRCCYYILFYAENVVFLTYLFQRANFPEIAENYKKHMMPTLERLRKLHERAKAASDLSAAYEIAEEMINASLQAVIDPF